jgi:iron complex transport system ATP-binding protein
MMLRVDSLAFAYADGGRRLEQISFAIGAGEIMCVLGPNGAGKTTLIRCILGGLKLSGGEVFVQGRRARHMTARQFASHVAYVPQSIESVFGHQVLDIVLMGRSAHLSMTEAPGARDRSIAERALDRVGIPHLARRPFSTISGGERQLCLLARALTQQAPILILDEPAASLDFANQIRILEIIADLERGGYAILMTTHHPDHALLVGTKVLALRQGRVFGIGEPSRFLTSRALSDLYDAPVRVLEERDGVRACVPVLHHANSPAEPEFTDHA